MPMVDILVTANGYKASDAIELITKPLEDIVKAINGVEHVYSFTQDDAVLVTARFFVGTIGGHRPAAHPREDPRQHRRPAQGHSRAADRRPRHQRRGDRGPDARAQGRRGGALDRQRPATRSPTSCGTNWSRSTTSASATSSAAAPTRSASSPTRSGWRSTASRSTSSSTSWPTPTGPSWPAPSGSSTAASRWWSARPCRACPTSASCCSRRATAVRSTSRTSPPSWSARPSPATAPGR